MDHLFIDLILFLLSLHLHFLLTLLETIIVSLPTKNSSANCGKLFKN